MAFLLPLGLGLVAAFFLLTASAEVFYLFYWRKRPLAGPRLNNVTVAPVNEGDQVEVRDESGAAVVIDVTCAEYQISTLQQDLVEKLFPSLSSMSHEVTHHTMVGPPRMLFTIKEETREELEILDMDCKWGGGGGRSRSKSKSMGDIPLSPTSASPLSPIGTPFITPVSSPDLFSSPFGTPTRSFSPLFPLSSQSQSHPHPASPVLLKTSCRIMYDYPNPPFAPPSPTRPTFSFLACRNVASSYNRSSSTGNLMKFSSNPHPAPPRGKPLFQHLEMSSPIHKQVDCVVTATSPLQTYTYENDEDDSSSASFSPQSSSPDRSPNFYSTPTPSFDPIPIPGPTENLVPPSSRGSSFNRRRGASFFSPLSSPSDGDSPYASPLLVIPSRAKGDGDESEGEFESCSSPAPASLVLFSSEGHEIIREEKFAPPATTNVGREGVMSTIVLPTPFSFQAARTKAQSLHPTAPLVVCSEVT